MYLRHLSVADFRSWRAAELDLHAGPVALVGPNGQGKTNLLEAIGYLATLGSHRAATDTALVRAGAERAVVRAAVVAAGRELRPEIEIVPGKANRARLGSTALPRARELLGAVRTVLFAPEDLSVVRGDPGERRRFLDDLLVARRPRLAGVRADYERVLRQRAALLKTAGAGRRGSSGELPTLDVWDGHLAQHGAELLHERLVTVQALRPHVAAAHATVAPDAPPLSMTYLSQTPAAALAGTGPAAADDAAVAGAGAAEATGAGAGLPTIAELRDSLLEQLGQVRAAELERGVNLAGPHRDELEFRLAELPVRGYASQGESWSVALALRLGSYELLRADDLPGGDPVLLLDDVFAQLDGQRREQLARAAAKAEQAIITAAVAADVPAELADVRFRVAEGRVTPDG